MISLAEARAYVLDRCSLLAGRKVPLGGAAGCVTAEPVVAAEAVPPFANSAMDGFAVRAADTAGAAEDRPVRLVVVATVAAGAPATTPVGAGQAVRIMTGAPMPPGADAVVLVERSRPVGDEVDLTLEVAPGTSVREAGGDVRPGDEVLAAGVVLGPAHLGVLASLGLDRVMVVGRPVVGVLSTGDELVPRGRPLGPGQIRDSNRAMLLALVAAGGGTAVDLGWVPDDEAALEAALVDGARRCDALVTSGGVSMGDFDVVKVVLDRIAEMRWMQIAIKPAKPFAFGLLGRASDAAHVPVFGLPGNPVSSLVSFELLARPALRRMAGHHHLDRPAVTAVADAPLDRRPDGKAHYVRVRTGFDGERFHARPVAAQGSHQLAATAGADGLAVLPDGHGIPAGGTVEVLLLDAESSLRPLP